MKLIILVSCLTVIRADFDAVDVCIDGIRYQKEILYKNITTLWPYTLALDYNNNNIYFSGNYRPGILKLNTGEHEYLKRVTAVRSLAVDQGTHDLYIGTDAGIYRYKPSTGAVELLGAARVRIYNEFFKGILYYVEYWSNRVFKYQDGQSVKLNNMPYKVDKFVIDNEDVIFFSNKTGVYSQQKNSNQTTLYDDAHVLSLALDRKGKVFFSTKDGIYEVIKYNSTSRKAVSIKDALGFVFDKNNHIIYSDQKMIYRLKPMAGGNKAKMCIDNKNSNTDNNTVDRLNKLERILDTLGRKVDKLVTDQMKMEDRINRKIDKVVNAAVDNKLDNMNKKLDRILIYQVKERSQHNKSST